MIGSALVSLAVGWGVAAASMWLAWVDQRASGNAAIVDVVWTVLVGVLSAAYAVIGGGYPVRRALFAAMVIAWAARLSAHLLQRVTTAGPGARAPREDPRYAAMRASWGGQADARFFRFFQQQAVAAVFFATPALAIARNAYPQLLPLEYLGAAVWVVAFAGEWAADHQLARWKRDPANRRRTCRSGLWAWSRHPNYFFEWLIWVAWAIFALASPPWGVIALLCPAAMLYLLLRVTGIPLAEAQALGSRGGDYRDYQRTTSRFVPRPPRRATALVDSTRRFS